MVWVQILDSSVISWAATVRSLDISEYCQFYQLGNDTCLSLVPQSRPCDKNLEVGNSLQQATKEKSKKIGQKSNTYKWAHVPSPTGGALGNAIKTASDASCGASRQGQAICLLCFPLANSSLVVLIISTSISTYEQKRRDSHQANERGRHPRCRVVTPTELTAAHDLRRATGKRGRASLTAVARELLCHRPT